MLVSVSNISGTPVLGRPPSWCTLKFIACFVVSHSTVRSRGREGNFSDTNFANLAVKTLHKTKYVKTTLSNTRFDVITECNQDLVSLTYCLTVNSVAHKTTRFSAAQESTFTQQPNSTDSTHSAAIASRYVASAQTTFNSSPVVVSHTIVQFPSKQTQLPRIPLLLSDVLSGLLLIDGLNIFNAGACFYCRGNLFSGRFLVMDDFSGSSIPAFSRHATI
jgi:hypothetical protein